MPRRNLINERLERQAEDVYIDSRLRPGRQSQTMAGHHFLSRPALTKANPLYADAFEEDGAGGWTASRYVVYGLSTYGGTDVYAEV